MEKKVYSRGFLERVGRVTVNTNFFFHLINFLSPEAVVLFSAMGCYWGIERQFWNIHGVYSTQVRFIIKIQ